MRKIGNFQKGYDPLHPVKIPTHDYLMPDYMPDLWCHQNGKWVKAYRASMGHFEIVRAAVGDSNCFSFEKRIPSEQTKRKILINTPLATSFPVVFDLIKAKFEVWIWTQAEGLVLCDDVGIKLDDIFPMKRNTLLNALKENEAQVLILDHFKLQKLQWQALAAQKQVSIGDTYNPLSMIYQTEIKLDKKDEYYSDEMHFHQAVECENKQEDLDALVRNELKLSDLLWVSQQARKAFIHSLEVDSKDCALCIDIEIEKTEVAEAIINFSEISQLPFVLVIPTGDILNSYWKFFNSRPDLVSKVDEIRFTSPICPSIDESDITDCLNKFSAVQRLTTFITLGSKFRDFLQSPEALNFTRSLTSFVIRHDDAWLADLNVEFPHLGSLYLVDFEDDADVKNIQALLEHTPNLTWLRVEKFNNSEQFVLPPLMKLERLTLLCRINASLLATLKDEAPKLTYLCLGEVLTSERVPLFEELPRKLTTLKYFAANYGDDEDADDDDNEDDEKTVEHYSMWPIIIKNAANLVDCVFFFHDQENRCQLEQIKGFLPISFPKLKKLTLKNGQKDDNTLAVFFPGGHSPPCLERFDSEMGWWMNSELNYIQSFPTQSKTTKMTDWRLMTYNFCVYDSRILSNLTLLRRLILIVEFADNINNGILSWNELDTQTLTRVKLPNLTQLTIIYKMSEWMEHLLKLNSGIANALITAVSTQLTALTFGQARADLSTEIIQLEDSIKFNNLRSLSVSLPLSIENPESLLRRCPSSLQFLAIELSQSFINQFGQLLQGFQSLTDLHIYITDTTDNAPFALFSGIIELPVLRQLSILVEDVPVSIMDMPRMPKLTELTLHQINIASQSLISTMNSTQTLRHLRLDQVIVTGDDARMIQPQPLLFLSLTDSILPQAFITLIKAARTRLQWLNLTNLTISEAVSSQSNVGVWPLVDEKEIEATAFPQLRLNKTAPSFDVGEMNPATIVLKKAGEYPKLHLLPKEVHEVENRLVENRLEEKNSSLNTHIVGRNNDKQITRANKFFLPMPYGASRAEILNSIRLVRMRCLSGSSWSNEDGLVFYQEELQKDPTCKITLDERAISSEIIHSTIEAIEKNNPQQNVVLSLAVVKCVLQQREFFQLPMRGASDELIAISFSGRTIKIEDLFIIRGSKGFFCVCIKTDPTLPVKQTGLVSYVLQSLWHEINPVTENITKNFLGRLINEYPEDICLNWRLEEILPQINQLSTRFRKHNDESLTDEEYELPEQKLLENIIQTGRGTCGDRAQAGVNYIRRILKVNKVTSADFEISIIKNQVHVYPEIKISYTINNRRQWIILRLEWGGIQLPRETEIIDTPQPLVIRNNHDANDLPLFSEIKLVREKVQDVIEYAEKQLTVKADASNPTLLIFDEAVDVSYFSLLILSIAQQQDIPVFYARTLNELQCVTKGLIQTQPDSDVLEYKQNCETKLNEFLQSANKNPGKNYFLMINWRELVEEDSSVRVTFNSMMDTENPKIDGVDIPDNVQIISLDGFQAKFDRSFLRRHSCPEEFPSDVQTVQKVLAARFNILPMDQKKIEPAILETVSTDRILELGGSVDHWKSILLGSPYLDHNSGRFKLESSPPLTRLLKREDDEKSNFMVLSNPPLEDLDFIFFMMRAQIEGVHSFGHFYPPTYFAKFRWSDQIVRHWEELLTNVVEFYETTPFDTSFLPLSPTFSKAFIQKIVIGEREREKIQTQPGWLEQSSGETLTIYLTETVSCLTWFELLSAAKKHRVSLRVYAQIQTLPNEIRSHFKAKASIDNFSPTANNFKTLFPGDRCHCSIVTPEQLDTIVEQYKQQWAISDETENHVIIDGQDLALPDIGYVFNMQGIEARAVYVKRTYTHFWQALVEGKTILLKGALSEEVCRWLEDVCRYQQRGLWNGSDWVDWSAADKGQIGCLHIVTTSQEGFSPTFIANGLSKPLLADVDMTNVPSASINASNDVDMIEAQPISPKSDSIFNNSINSLFKKRKRSVSDDGPYSSVKHTRLSEDQFIASIHDQAQTTFFLHLEGSVSLGDTSIPARLVKDSRITVFLASQIQAWAAANPESGALVYLYLNQIPTGHFKTLGEAQEQFCYQGKFFQLSPQHRVIIHSEASLLFPAWLSKKNIRTISLPDLDIENTLTDYLTPIVTKTHDQDSKARENDSCSEEPSNEQEKKKIGDFFRSFAQLAISGKPFIQVILHEKVLQRILCSYLARRKGQDTLLFFADQLAQGILTTEDYADFQVACQQTFPQEYQPDVFLSEHKCRAIALVNEQQHLQQQRSSEKFGFVIECAEALIALESTLRLCQWMRAFPKTSLFKPAQIITGDTSVGKSSLVRNYLHNREYREIGYRKLLSLKQEMENSNRFCLIPANLDQKTKKEILTRTFHAGVLCVLDEFEARGLEDFLYDLLNGYDADQQPAKNGGFALICTRNPLGYGNDRQPLPRSLRRFFWDCNYPFYSKPSIEKVLSLHNHPPTNELGKAIDGFIAQSKERVAFGDPPVAFSKLLTLANGLSKKETGAVPSSSLVKADDAMDCQDDALPFDQHEEKQTDVTTEGQDAMSSSTQKKEKSYSQASFRLVNTWTASGDGWIQHSNPLETIPEQQTRSHC